MAEPARAFTPADALDAEVQEALALCQGDPMKALRVTLIANAFLEAELDQLTAAVSTGFTRRKTGKPRKEAKAS